MILATVRAEVAVLDDLLREIAQRPVDPNDPDRADKLRRGPAPVAEAGVEVAVQQRTRPGHRRRARLLREVAVLSSDVDRYGFGAMRLLIMRGAEHNLD